MKLVIFSKRGRLAQRSFHSYKFWRLCEPGLHPSMLEQTPEVGPSNICLICIGVVIVIFFRPIESFIAVFSGDSQTLLHSREEFISIGNSMRELVNTNKTETEI